LVFNSSSQRWGDVDGIFVIWLDKGVHFKIELPKGWYQTVNQKCTKFESGYDSIPIKTGRCNCKERRTRANHSCLAMAGIGVTFWRAQMN
jgi:hypothetical protein